MKIKLSGKRLYLSNSVKYLDIRFDRYLHWHDLVNSITVKLNGANTLLLLKIGFYFKTLRNIYLAIIESHLSYLCIVCGQNVHEVSRLIISQKKHYK